MLGRWLRRLGQSYLQRGPSGRARVTLCAPSRRLRLEWLELRLAPALHFWTGGGVTDNWSESDNWQGGPPADDYPVALIFHAAHRQTNKNDIAGLVIQTITFTANDYSIDGNAITLIGGITANDNVTGIVHFDADIILGAVQAWTVGTSPGHGDGTLEVGGLISGPPGADLIKSGEGTLLLSNGMNSFHGAITISEGTLREGSPMAVPFGAAMQVFSGATFDYGNQDVYLDKLDGDKTTMGRPPSGGVVEGAGTLTLGVLGGSNSSAGFGGRLTGLGDLDKRGAGTFTLSGASNDYSGITVIHEGSLRLGINDALPRASDVSLGKTGVLDLDGFSAAIGSLAGVGTVNLVSGTLTTGDNSSTTFGGNLSGTGRLMKQGTGTLTLTGANTNYSGAITVGEGELHIGGDEAFPSRATVMITTGAILDFTSGTNSLLGSSNISGTGSVSFNGGTTNLFAAYDLTGSPTGTQVFGGIVNFLSPVVSLGNALAVSGGQVNLSGGAGILIQRMTLSGGVLGGSDPITVTNQMSWTAGTMSGSGTTTIDSGGQGTAQMLISSTAPKYLDGRALNNRPGGHIIWMDNGGILMGESSSVNNAGAFDAEDGNHFDFNGNPGDMPEVINARTLNVSGTILFNSGITFVNDGMVNGNVQNGGLLFGSGTINGSLTNMGQVNPGDPNATGALTITGNYTQTAAGVLNIRIGSAGSDQLIIAGQATLDGTLKVSLINNFVPPSGSTYQIVLFSSPSGMFATTNIDPSFVSPPTYDPTDVTIQAI
ncbi:MAG TPA: autotransporter-associated beta strand repeat-containing protein [Gemmataceae bacterium]|nr:autotransporter-associated beta strand repeat-containing protein [Gemmataceae bacterium]